MLLFDNIAGLYENISTIKLLVVTSPCVAAMLYFLFTNYRIAKPRFYNKRLALLPFLIGLVYCVITSLMLNHHFIKVLIASVSAYTFAVFIIERAAYVPVLQFLTPYFKKLGLLLERFTCTATAVLIALLILPSLFYGFDVTDGGFHASQGLLVFHNGLKEAHLSNLVFLTYYISGAITSMTHYLGFGLVGLRIVWMCVFIFPFVVTIHILRNVFFSHWLLPLFGLAAAASCSIYTTVLEYEKVPAFFAACVLYFFYRTYEGKEPKFRPEYAVSLGVFFFLLLLSRITVIPLLVVFLAPALYAIRHAAIRKNVAMQLVGFVIAASAFLVLLYQAGDLNAFFTYRNPTGGHSLTEIWHTIFEQLHDYVAQQIIGILVLVPLVLVLAFKTPKTLIYILLLAGVLVLAAPPLYWAHALMGRTFPVVLGTAITLYGYFILRLRPQRLQPFLFPLLVMAALILPGAQGGGSDAGLIRFASGGWFLVPLAMMLLLYAASIQHNSSARYNLYAVTIAVTIVFFVSGFQTFHRYPYADNSDRRNMTGVFIHPLLKGIHSTPGRVESFEGLLGAIAIHKPHDSDRLLAYNNLPMVFYASQTYPLFNYTWITCLSEAVLTLIAEDICTSQETTPGLIVRTKVEVRNGTWGNNPVDPIIEDDILSAKSKGIILDKGIKKCRSVLVWENNDFQLLKPSLVRP